MQYTTRRQLKSPRPLQIRPEQPTPSLQNCHAHSLKTAKHFSEQATYLAFFSVTYLATSLKLAKFSVTERTTVLSTAKTACGSSLTKLDSSFHDSRFRRRMVDDSITSSNITLQRNSTHARRSVPGLNSDALWFIAKSCEYHIHQRPTYRPPHKQ